MILISPGEPASMAESGLGLALALPARALGRVAPLDALAQVHAGRHGGEGACALFLLYNPRNSAIC